MKTISTITFHNAHNFGSALQSYALQTFVKNICVEHNTDATYRIINYHTKYQEELYSVFKHKSGAKNIIKNILALRYKHDLKEKHRKFQEFIANELTLTTRYYSEEEIIKNPPESDYFISGSDQIWNVRALDFSDVYYLNFVSSGKKISYAASFGPLKIDWSRYDSSKYRQYLEDYSAISVREQGSADNVFTLIGKAPMVHVDPTFLLTREQWRTVQSKCNYNGGRYILLYCLEPSKQQIQLAKRISTKLKLPIVVLRYNNRNDWFNSFVKRYDSGPLDFLSYVDNAALVLSSSFHGTAFSIIYRKPFYVFNGMDDNRISSILNKTGLTERCIYSESDLANVKLDLPNQNMIDHYLKEARTAAKSYLIKSLNII